MKKISTVLFAATIAVASTAASAWGWGPFGNNGYNDYNNSGWGDGYGDGDFDGDFGFNMSGSSRAHGRGYGQGRNMLLTVMAMLRMATPRLLLRLPRLHLPLPRSPSKPSLTRPEKPNGGDSQESPPFFISGYR